MAIARRLILRTHRVLITNCNTIYARDICGCPNLAIRCPAVHALSEDFSMGHRGERPYPKRDQSHRLISDGDFNSANFTGSVADWSPCIPEITWRSVRLSTSVVVVKALSNYRTRAGVTLSPSSCHHRSSASSLTLYTPCKIRLTTGPLQGSVSFANVRRGLDSNFWSWSRFSARDKTSY